MARWGEHDRYVAHVENRRLPGKVVGPCRTWLVHDGCLGMGSFFAHRSLSQICGSPLRDRVFRSVHQYCGVASPQLFSPGNNNLARRHSRHSRHRRTHSLERCHAHFDLVITWPKALRGPCDRAERRGPTRSHSHCAVDARRQPDIGRGWPLHYGCWTKSRPQYAVTSVPRLCATCTRQSARPSANRAPNIRMT